MGTVPALALDYDTNWLPIGPDDDPQVWADAAAAEMMTRDGVVDDEGVRATLRDRLATVAEAAVREPMLRGFVMCPPVDLTIRCVVRMVTIELENGMSEEVARETVVRALSPEPDRAAAVPQRDRMDSPAGPVERLVTRTAGGDDRVVVEDLYYIWVFAQDAGSAVLVTSFYDLTEAGRWRPVVDKLAAGLEVVP